MNWIPIKHKNLYYKAAGALYEDAKSLSSSLLDTTGKVLSDGYEKIKESANYIDKKWHESEEDNGNNNGKNPLLDSEEDDYSSDYIEDTDESLVNMGKIYPDILIELNPDKKYLQKIYVFDQEGNKKRITGKLASYDYINKIIHKWFIYDNYKTKTYHWYPHEELYTAYRENNQGRLNPMDNIIFQYDHEYKPYYYHPLM